MKRILRQIFEDIKHGENIDLMVTVALALIIAILDLFGMTNTELISTITLATLGLLAMGLLLTRYKMDNIQSAQDFANSVHFSRQPLSSFDVHLRSENVKEIWMLGLVLRGTIYRNFFSLKQHSQVGTKMRVLISNRNKINTDTTVRQFTRGGHAKGKEGIWFPAGYEETLNRMAEIRQAAPDVDNIRLRLLDFVPSFSLYIFPRIKDGGVLYVEIYCYKSEDGSIPKFRITQHENPQWYRHFVQQFEFMWKDGEEHSFD